MQKLKCNWVEFGRQNFDQYNDTRAAPSAPPILSHSQQERQGQNSERMSNNLPPQDKMDKQKLRAEISPRVSKNSAQRLSRDLTCSICLDLFKRPVSLPCDHTFCEACITSYWSGPRGKGQGGSGSCPQCRKVFPGHSYRPNRIVANIVESYCQGIEESGGWLTGLSADTVPPTPLCSRHREELKLYCEEDHELVCLVCGISQDHRAHTLVCVQDAQQRYRASLTTSANALQKELNTALECERETEEEVKKLKDHTADLKQRIEAQGFSRVVDEKRRCSLVSNTDLMWKTSVPASRTEPISSISFFLSFLQSIKGLLQRQPPKFEKPALTPPRLCEGRFAGPLQYRVWKSLKGSIYPVPSAITFNSKTANPWLSLTSSLTCVRYQTFNNVVQDNPQRFNAALSLLGSQGFTKCRHYWEVEVYSSTVWTVGVARESVTRKGVINTMPANGFWTLSLSYGVQYMAGTSPPTLLSLEEPLARIGVYLDYKRGLVSFYNAESMTHLYTFKDIFTETLYPYFNLGFLDKVHENEPLKVFLPKI
uniref:Tripartite motif containing 69 n=1 Tax=Sinocyclocheilus rhinocerous TaxID=307959 RepID=A0A673MBI4_9TELE